MFLSQGEPFPIPADMLALPASPGVNSLTIWVVPGDAGHAVAFRAILTSPEEASDLYKEVAPETDEWTYLSGSTIYLVKGEGSGAKTLKRAIKAGDFVSLEEKEPKIRNEMNRLPKEPPAKAVMMGFAKPKGSLIESFAKGKQAKGLGDISSAIDKARAQYVILGLYSDKLINPGDIKQASDLKELELGFLVVTKSGIPGFLLAPLFGTIAGMFGMDKIDLSGETAYHRDYEGLAMVLKGEGNLIYLSVAPELEFAKKLMSSALGK
jgi:hypothetical protein